MDWHSFDSTNHFPVLVSIIERIQPINQLFLSPERDSIAEVNRARHLPVFAVPPDRGPRKARDPDEIFIAQQLEFGIHGQLLGG